MIWPLNTNSFHSSGCFLAQNAFYPHPHQDLSHSHCPAPAAQPSMRLFLRGPCLFLLLLPKVSGESNHFPEVTACFLRAESWGQELGNGSQA